MSFIFVIVYV